MPFKCSSTYQKENMIISNYSNCLKKEASCNVLLLLFALFQKAFSAFMLLFALETLPKMKTFSFTRNNKELYYAICVFGYLTECEILQWLEDHQKVYLKRIPHTIRISIFKIIKFTLKVFIATYMSLYGLIALWSELFLEYIIIIVVIFLHESINQQCRLSQWMQSNCQAHGHLGEMFNRMYYGEAV